MLLQLEHLTQSDYAPDVEEAWHLACLRPLDAGGLGGQALVSHQLRIEPAPEFVRERTDAFGNRVHWFCLHEPHAHCRVVAQSVVRTEKPRAASDAQAALTWEQGRDALRYGKGKSYAPETEFLHASALVGPHEEFLAYAQPSFSPGAALMQAATALSSRIHHEFRYDSQSTDVNTPPLTALRERHGVCQDFAHILIACLRSLGLAARYVSGYLLTEPPPGQPRLVGADASHAWASLYLGSGQWLDLDPTNDRSGIGSPGEDYVTLALGRDYHDIAPLKGIIHGAQAQTQTVGVTVAPL